MDELLNLIGSGNGAQKPFDQWVQEARAAGLQPNMIQRLKRMGVVYTKIDPATGQNIIVRGTRPVSS